MNLNEYIFVIITIFTMLILFSILLFSFFYLIIIKTKKPNPITIPVVNFEQDILFLNFLIQNKIADIKNFNLAPMRFSRSTIITDPDLDKLRDEVIESIFFNLSTSYKNTLYKYFSEEGLLTYITEQVFKELTLTTLESNFNSLS